MKLIQATVLLFAIGLAHAANDQAGIDHHNQLHHHHPHSHLDRSAPSPIPVQMTGEDVKIPETYEKKQFNTIESRDQGCAEFEHKHEEAHGCINVWLKNRFSAADIAPFQFMTEFHYYGNEHSYRPVVTWVEKITPKYVRACAAAVPGKLNVLAGGRIKWLALYNYTQSAVEKSGVIQSGQLTNVKAYTADKHCFAVSFPTPFANTPTMKFTLKLKHGYHSAQDAMVVWAKGITASSAVVCFEEFHAWARYHNDYELQWYGIADKLNIADNYAQHGIVSFPANQALPANHNDLHSYHCKIITLSQKLYPCPTVLVQGVEPSLETCESPVSAWISYISETEVRVCYADRRGLTAVRVNQIDVHFIIYGSPDPCNGFVCPSNKECIRPTPTTAACGCIKSCDMSDKAEVCGTNMKVYANRCTLEKESCESGYKFVYAHKGKCEKNTIGHGRHILSPVPSCQGLYCADVSTHNYVWYKDAPINVQISTSWSGQAGHHGASSSWVEKVTPTKFKACVMQPGRASLSTGPTIQWFAYQGEVDEVKSHRIEVGDWTSGTHCVPVHERKRMDKPHPFSPLMCPRIPLKDVGKVDQDKWQYDAHLMAQVYGQHHHEWFKRMLMGYGVKKLNLTNGMEFNGATLMMTVEHTHQDATVVNKGARDAVNVWMEYDENTHESYVCLREMQNWDGKHKGIHVHWTLLNNTMIRNLGFSHKLMFKPAPQSGGFDHPKGQCQTKAFLPKDMDLTMGATALVSITHRIKPYSSVDSMKKYSMHHDMVMQGMNMGEAAMSKDGEPQNSWMMPHMWRANLTGWRPHMRINKDVDYSAWIESMNNTHLTVCQSSTYNGFAHNGVAVNVFILPDRCPQGYYFLNNNMCGKHVEQCTNVQDAANRCAAEGSILAAPQDCPTAVHLSYLARQRDIHTAKTDSAVEGTWQVGFGVPQPATNWFNWAANNPSAGPNDRDCALQGGISKDFKEYDEPCSTCHQYVCVRPAPWLSCGFRKPGFCNDCGTCSKVQPFNFKCDCIPPYHGTHCEVRKPEADQ